MNNDKFDILIENITLLSSNKIEIAKLNLNHRLPRKIDIISVVKRLLNYLDFHIVLDHPIRDYLIKKQNTQCGKAYHIYYLTRS